MRERERWQVVFMNSETNDQCGKASSWGQALPRGLALFLGGFSLLNLLGGFRVAGFDANLWWMDLRLLPPLLTQALLLAAAVCLLAFGVQPPRSSWRRWLTLSFVGTLAIAGLANSVQFYVLLAHGTVRAAIPIPLSLFISAALVLVLAAARGPLPAGNGGKHRLLQVATVLLACSLGFPLMQMVCFGKTDYRRPADVAVVLGARVYADGRPSDALADRVRTACQLYRDGLVRKLICSGGPGDETVHETASMKRLAIQLGVKPEDILVDEAGLNTQATVKNTGVMFNQLRASRILVVSHFYHLPRIKLAYQRAGWEVYTVPARESYWLRQLPYNMLREVAALWVYYLRPLAQ